MSSEREQLLSDLWVRYFQLLVQQRHTAHSHREAFCVMYYSDEAGHFTRIWNARDGVTPFVVVVDDNGVEREMRHVDWHNDLRDTERSPRVGEHIFIDDTPDRLLADHERFVAEHWDSMQGNFTTSAEAVRSLAMGCYQSGLPPLLVVVTEELRRERGWDQRLPSRLQERTPNRLRFA
jgi:hypothetical protein